MRKIPVILVILLGLLCACSPEEQIVQIEDKDFANILLIQKVENNFTSEQLSKQIEDQEMIEQVLTMVEGLKVEEIDNEELIKILESQDNYYMFDFYEGEDTNILRGDYGFHVLEDGTMLFNVDLLSVTNPLVTVETHKELLEAMKEMLEINF
ncbi:hypothetical protein [Gracilibacillus sp. HCP3S3_G5_2]|uniref:hypothetical protein n=1 Tax=Gracilibacillus sp. HCP3S3_G5_2 TaxID=3438941 RepID=UPI003F8B4B62